jgi:hypothetical protein
MLGRWAAAKRGLSGALADDYAKALVDAEVGTTPNLVFARMLRDLAALGVAARQLRNKRDALLAIARAVETDGSLNSEA